MKHLTHPILLLFVSALAFAGADQARAQSIAPFEGTIVYKVSLLQAGSAHFLVTTSIKGDKEVVTADLGTQGPQHIYIDLAKRSMSTLTSGSTSVVTESLTPDSEITTVELRSTGGVRTIGAFKAVEMVGFIDDDSLDIWATADLPQDARGAILEAMLNSSRGGRKTVFATMRKMGLLPIRMTFTDGGKPSVVIELTELQQKAVEDTELNPPAAHINPGQD